MRRASPLRELRLYDLSLDERFGVGVAALVAIQPGLSVIKIFGTT
jgi:hypothetical protein